MQKQKQKQAYFNFVHSLNSEQTKKMYVYCLDQFLSYCKLDLNKFLKLPEQKMTNIITEYLVQKKVSRQFKNVFFFTIKHACEVNDVILNWKKIQKFIRSDQKTGNEISGKDRGYEHKEIQQILNFSEQRFKTAFLILTSTGMRIGALGPLKVGDLERIDDLYKISVYSGEYSCFCTPEAAKEIDAYLEFRKRRGEIITKDSFLIVKKFSPEEGVKEKGVPFKGDSLKAMLQCTIENSGLREIDHNNPRKHKQTPLFHAFRKFTTKQLIDSNVKAEIREMLLGHKIGLTGVYYKPTDQEMYEEYCKALDNLTIDPANRLQRKVETLTIEKSRLDKIEEKMRKIEKMYG